MLPRSTHSTSMALYLCILYAITHRLINATSQSVSQSLPCGGQHYMDGQPPSSDARYVNGSHGTVGAHWLLWVWSGVIMGSVWWRWFACLQTPLSDWLTVHCTLHANCYNTTAALHSSVGDHSDAVTGCFYYISNYYKKIKRFVIILQAFIVFIFVGFTSS